MGSNVNITVDTRSPHQFCGLCISILISPSTPSTASIGATQIKYRGNDIDPKSPNDPNTPCSTKKPTTGKKRISSRSAERSRQAPHEATITGTHIHPASAAIDDTKNNPPFRPY